MALAIISFTDFGGKNHSKSAIFNHLKTKK